MIQDRLSRRALLAGGAAAGALATLPAGPLMRRALAQAAPGQAPGFFRFRLGELAVTTLSDGNLVLQPPSIYAANAPEGEVTALLEAHLLPTDRVVGQANVTLVETGGRKILFDVGSGSGFQPTAGKLAANLEAAGIDPATIDLVVITHAHPDHCWGLLDEFDEPRFAQATYMIAEPEWAFWMAEGLADQVPDGMKPFVVGAQRQLGAVQDRVTRFMPGDEVAPGIRSMAAFGHTPGHTAFTLSSGDRTLLLSADSFNHPVISLANPGWHFGFDADPAQASANRKQLLDMAAIDRIPVIGYHMPWPGLGHVVPEGGGYRWLPENFVWSL